jgi:hypothetical protein
MVMTSADPRQRGLFASAWAVGYLAGVIRGRAAAVSLFSPWGPSGIIYRQANHIQPWYDKGGACVYPVFHVMTGLSSASGKQVVDASSSEPDVVDCLAYSTKDGRCLWLANLTETAQKVTITGMDSPCSIATLDEASYGDAVTDPESLLKKACFQGELSEIQLKPYAVAFVRWRDSKNTDQPSPVRRRSSPS